LKRIRWKANQVISIETRRRDESRVENVYALAQMIGVAGLLVFNVFNTNNRWENIELKHAPILFYTTVARQFISNSNVFVQDINPLESYLPPVRQIDILEMDGAGAGYRKVVLWEGTANEREVLVMGAGGGRLIEGHIGNCKVIIPVISEKDDNTIDKYELTNVRIYAELNERLFLCYKFGKNVDPLKDLTFNRHIPIEYKEYMNIIMS